jgi:hypothetical protein
VTYAPGCPSLACRDRPERGAATVFVAVTGIGLLALVGLAIDGGAAIRAIERADTLAAEAARTAGQAIDLPAVLTGQPAAVDPARARTAATTYLRANHATGTTTTDAAGHTITVRVTTSRPTVFLGLIGIHEITAHGEATAILLPGTETTTP